MCRGSSVDESMCTYRYNYYDDNGNFFFLNKKKKKEEGEREREGSASSYPATKLGPANDLLLYIG